MQVTIQAIQGIYAENNYVWDPYVNIVGIRTNLQVPDVFNDLLCVVWKQNAMPAGLSLTEQQSWLNMNLFPGSDMKPLKVDGNFALKSKFALNTYNECIKNGALRIKSYVITTDPGVYWLNNPMSKLGTAVLKPGQYLNSHAIGLHQGKPEHRALVQVGKVTVFRDNDKDNLAEAASTTESGLFGINLHGANRNMVSYNVGKWSAGCQVFQDWSRKEEFINICETFKGVKGNKFTYTLLLESDFDA